MTTATELRETFYDLVIAPAEHVADWAERSAIIGAAVRDFCRAFPEDAGRIADLVAADYAARDRLAPRVPYRLDAPAPRADEPIDVAF